jgi:small-conductance mechanosensitive channel
MPIDALRDLPGWVPGTATLLVALLGAWIAHRILFGLGTRVAARTSTGLDDSLLRHGRRPALAILSILVALTFLPAVDLPAPALAAVKQVLAVVLTLSIGWLGIALTNLLTDYVAGRYRLDVTDNLLARRIHTQMRVVRRILATVIGVVVVCLVLMSFPRARDIGLSLFASAGVAGLIIGMAARPALANLIAGVQIAFTGTIHLDDVVIVEGEWGRIEEIGASYVVVRIWDDRRLVVPLSQFIEKPFQNWTRHTADLLGTVMLYADYTVPVDDVRARLKEIVAASPLWDGRVCGLQMTDATDRGVELRALVSASDASKAWDLRCLVREELVKFLQSEHPGCLPRVRTQISSTAPSPGMARTAASTAGEIA